MSVGFAQEGKKEEMKVQLVVAFLGLVVLQLATCGAESEAVAADLVKRRGWGKRGSAPEAFPLDALADNADELEKRRGWGKRDFEKRRGWGKRSDLDLDEDMEEMDKRRGWGKRMVSSGTDADAIESEIAKRRGWGKRDAASVAELASELSHEMDKRRGWGKRAYQPYEFLDAAAGADASDAVVDKRRGWGKRYGWGKRADDADLDEKRYGWGKR